MELPIKTNPIFVNWTDVTVLSKKKCRVPIRTDLKYAGPENFLGRPVVGYHSDAKDVALLTKLPALALCDVQNYLIHNYELGLIVYDTYRPVRAVKDFNIWMNQPPAGELELERKKIHYPHLEKNQLADLGYISTTISRHSYGHVVDASLIALDINNDTHEEMNMGAVFDFFDKTSQSSKTAVEIGQEAFDNRAILISVMSQFGFQVYEEEFWHFDFRIRELQEPVDFEITSSLRGLNNTF